MTRVAVLGATGFIGRAVMESLRAHGHEAVAIRAPRLKPVNLETLDVFILGTDLRAALAAKLQGIDAVINAAGCPRATDTDEKALIAVNGVLPGLLASVVFEFATTPRFVHVSSAVVQGNVSILDTRPARLDDTFSAYSKSKVIGEQLVLKYDPDAVVYRPPGVHGPDRAVTQMIARLARSPVRSVARPAASPSAQALLPNVASAITFLATSSRTPPSIVNHPSEGITTGSLLMALGGRAPRELPRCAASTILNMLALAERGLPRFSGQRRRLEMLWFGQGQAGSWLTDVGWNPPADIKAWHALGQQFAAARTF